MSLSNQKIATRKLSSEKVRVLSKEAVADLELDKFDVLPNWEPTTGKILTRVRAISARINQNFDGWPSEELKKSYRTFLGKPVFVNHVNDDPRKARGVVVAARFVENGDDKYIEVIQEVDAEKFPKLAHELISGGLDSVSMGAEARICKCSYCGNEASDMLSMCSHVLSKKGQVLGRVNDDGTREDVLVYEECRDVSFFELSYVFDPADETAVVSNVLTANRKRGYGETSLPPQVDTLRDEEEDLAGYFIDPPREFQEPDLDEDYPVVEEGQPFGHRRDEEQREDVQMTRVSRVPRNRRNADSNINRVRDTGIDLPSLVGLERGDWEGYERDFVNKQRAQGDLPPVLDYIQDNAYGRPTKDWEGNLPDEVIEYNPRQSNRRGRNMSHNRRARRRYAEEFGRNDQGEQEEVFISQTPPAEPVETGDGAADAPNNTKSDRVKTDQNRSNHTNLEARRRRARRRHAAPELYKDFLEYALGQGADLDYLQEMYDRNYQSNGMDEEADRAVYELESLMSDFANGDDSVFYQLLDAPGSYEINHPNNFRGASRKRRSRRRGPVRRMAEQSDDFNLNSRADIARDVEDEEVFISETDPQTQPKDASRKRRRRQALRRRHANPTRTVTDDIAEIMGISVPFKDGWEVINNPNMPTPTLYKEISDFDGVSVRPSDDGSFSWSVTRGFKNDGSGVASSAEEAMAMAEQAYAQRTSSRKRRSSRRRVATSLYDLASEVAQKTGIPEEEAESALENYLTQVEEIDGTSYDEDNLPNDVADFLAESVVQGISAGDFRNSSRKRRSSKRRRMADTNLDLAAPDGRVNVEAPVKDTTDEEAQASQFDKKDFGNNAGDHLADPDLSTDQNWAPGEGQKTSARASEIEGMRLAEAMVEAGLEAQEDRWKLAEAYTKLPANIVRDRIALLARTASAKSAVRDDKSQRPVKSAQKAPGLGQRPTLQKSANKSDDYTLYL